MDSQKRAPSAARGRSDHIRASVIEVSRKRTTCCFNRSSTSKSARSLSKYPPLPLPRAIFYFFDSRCAGGEFWSVLPAFCLRVLQVEKKSR
jgi:hypothetical protein